jgi:ubiquinone/menaquinone biosynthesis C-methylase UbiE
MADKSAPPLAVYQPEIFDVHSIEEAVEIIVTATEGTTAQERWEKETPFLVKDIGELFEIGPETSVLDYGCGIGRVAKGLIDAFGCRVIGVDFNPSMRQLAPEYVLSERFTIWSPEVLDKMIAKRFRADAVLCLWVLQHVLDVQKIIDRVAGVLKPSGLLYVLNSQTRCIPTDRGWVDDGVDVSAKLRAALHEEHRKPLPERVTVAKLARMSVIQILRKPS